MMENTKKFCFLLKLNVLVNVLLKKKLKKFTFNHSKRTSKGSRSFEIKAEQNHTFRSLLDVFSESENINVEVRHLFGIKIKNQCKTWAGKIRFFGAQKSVLLKAN